MKSFQIIKIINFFTQALILGIVFAIPLCLAFFLKTNNVFELNKLALFQILILLLLFFTFTKAVIQGVQRLQTNRAIFLLFYFFTFLLLSLAISTLFSVDPALSWHGSYDRLQGLQTYLYLILLFILLIINIKSKKQIKSIVWAAVLSSLLVCAYGLSQASGHDIFAWSESTKTRVTSTLGQPNHLGAYLLFVIPLSVYLFLSSKKIFIKIGLGLLAIAQILTLILAYSLSAWLGLLGGMLITAIFVIASEAKQSRFKILNFSALKFALAQPKSSFLAAGIAALFVIMTVFFFIFLNPGTIKYKIANLFNPESGSTAARIQFWNAAGQAIKSRPFFGYGPDAQGEVLGKYYQTDWAVPNNVNVRPTRAHNFFLDILLAQGIIGLLAWCALLYLFYYYIIINIRTNKQKSLNYAIFCALTAYLIFLQFQYHNITTLVYFFTLFALVVVINKKNNFVISPARRTGGPARRLGGNEAKRREKSLKLVYLTKLVILSVIGALAFLIINNNIKALAADHYFLELRKANLYNQYIAAFKMYDFIKEDFPAYDNYDKEFIKIMYDWGRRFDNDLFYQIINKKFKKILPNINNNNFSDYLSRAMIYSSLGREDKKYFARAIDNCDALVDLSPNMPLPSRLCGQIYYANGDFEKGAAEHNQALSKLPPLKSKGLNKKHENLIKQEMALNYRGLSSAYKKLGDKDKEEEFENAEKALAGRE